MKESWGCWKSGIAFFIQNLSIFKLQRHLVILILTLNAYILTLMQSGELPALCVAHLFQYQIHLTLSRL
jgi:hypothetical protein